MLCKEYGLALEKRLHDFETWRSDLPAVAAMPVFGKLRRNFFLIEFTFVTFRNLNSQKNVADDFSDDDACRDVWITPTHTECFAKIWFLSLKLQYFSNHFLFKNLLQMYRRYIEVDIYLVYLYYCAIFLLFQANVIMYVGLFGSKSCQP